MKRMMVAWLAVFEALCASADVWTNENGVVWTYAIIDGAATVGGGSHISTAVPRSTGRLLV